MGPSLASSLVEVNTSYPTGWLCDTSYKIQVEVVVLVHIEVGPLHGPPLLFFWQKSSMSETMASPSSMRTTGRRAKASHVTYVSQGKKISTCCCKSQDFVVCYDSINSAKAHQLMQWRYCLGLGSCGALRKAVASKSENLNSTSIWLCDLGHQIASSRPFYSHVVGHRLHSTSYWSYSYGQVFLSICVSISSSAKWE